MFLARDVEWRNKIVSTFREAGFPEGEQQWGLVAMSASGISDIWSERICQHLRTRTGPPAAHRLDTRGSLPTSYDHIAIVRLVLDRTTGATCFFGREQGCPATREGVEH